LPEAVIVVKTPKGLEKVAASRILELDPEAEVETKPMGFLGLVLVKPSTDPERLYEALRSEVLEAEKVLLAERVCEASPERIAKAAAEVSVGRISESDTFAVRTTRRGSHPFTSLDVNVAVGDAVVKATGADVDLTYPDKIVWVEIVGDKAYLSITDGSEEWRKRSPEKVEALETLSKMAVVQMPYLGPPKAAREMGVRVGRCVQTFEVRELYVAPNTPVKAEELRAFLTGVLEGIKSRFEVQRRVYARPVRRVPVFVQDLYQLVRDRRDEPMIVFEPEGRPAAALGDRIAEIFDQSSRVNLLVGSREGVPKGIFRIADMVLDICPGVTISTDFAAASAIMTLLTIVQERRKPSSKNSVSRNAPSRNRGAGGGI